MELQEKILNEYRELTGDATFKEISKDTGIQITRVFRIFNKSKMKLDEYEIFHKRVLSLKGGKESAFLDKAYEAYLKLPEHILSEVEEAIEYKLKIRQLMR